MTDPGRQAGARIATHTLIFFEASTTISGVEQARAGRLVLLKRFVLSLTSKMVIYYYGIYSRRHSLARAAFPISADRYFRLHFQVSSPQGARAVIIVANSGPNNIFLFT